MQTMEKTNVALHETSGMREQMGEMKTAFSKTADMISRHLETVKRQEQILDKALTVNKNIGAIQSVLEKNEKTMDTLSKVLERFAALQEKREVKGNQAPSAGQEGTESLDGEIFLPED